MSANKSSICSPLRATKQNFKPMYVNDLQGFFSFSYNIGETIGTYYQNISIRHYIVKQTLLLVFKDIALYSGCFLRFFLSATSTKPKAVDFTKPPGYVRFYFERDDKCIH